LRKREFSDGHRANCHFDFRFIGQIYQRNKSRAQLMHKLKTEQHNTDIKPKRPMPFAGTRNSTGMSMDHPSLGASPGGMSGSRPPLFQRIR